MIHRMLCYKFALINDNIPTKNKTKRFKLHFQITRFKESYGVKSQHTKLILEKNILPPLLAGFELATFQSRVPRSNKPAIPARN